MQKTPHTNELSPKRLPIVYYFLHRRNIVVEIIASLYILLFVYTSINKIVEFSTLKSVLKDYPLIGSIPVLVAWALPATELLIALLLFIPRTKQLGLYSALGLMTAFTVYVGYLLAFTPKLPCTCGGMLQKLSWPQHLLFNIFFMLLATLAIWLLKQSQKHNKL